MGYFSDLREGVSSTWQGLRLAIRHLGQARHQRTVQDIRDPKYFDKSQQTGQVTLDWPGVSMPLPENSRNTLHCEIDDCIVCDKCAKVCPVDCIAIESIKSPEVIGETSDGTAKRLYASRFDIDMSKCCFCGLCTTVCPTECLTMTDVYDVSVFDKDMLVYQFGEMTVTEMALRKEELAAAQAAKAQSASAAKTTAIEKPIVATAPTPEPAKPKPAFKPFGAAKKPTLAEEKPSNSSEEGSAASTPDPSAPTPEPAKLKPTFKPFAKKKAEPDADNPKEEEKP